MIDPTPKVRALAEAELYRAELEARRLARRLSLVGIAVFIALFAIVMLIVACPITFEGVSLDGKTANSPSTTPVVSDAQLPFGATPHPLVVKSPFVTAVARVSTASF